MQANFSNPAFAGEELGDRVVSRRKLKPTFGTQASALMKKNLVFQRRNWRASSHEHACVLCVGKGGRKRLKFARLCVPTTAGRRTAASWSAQSSSAWCSHVRFTARPPRLVGLSGA